MKFICLFSLFIAIFSVQAEDFVSDTQPAETVTASDTGSAKPLTTAERRANILGEFLKKSDVESGILVFWQAVTAQMLNMPPRNGKEGKVTRVPFNGDAMQAYAIQFLIENYNQDSVLSAIDWLSQEKTVKMYELLNQNYAGYDDWVTKLTPTTFPLSRRELILQLAAALHTRETTKVLFMLNGLALGTITTSASPALLESSSEMLFDLEKETLQTAALNRLFFCFRGVSDAELTGFVENLEQPIAQWTTAYMRGALLRSITYSIQDIRKGIRAENGR